MQSKQIGVKLCQCVHDPCFLQNFLFEMDTRSSLNGFILFERSFRILYIVFLVSIATHSVYAPFSLLFSVIFSVCSGVLKVRIFFNSIFHRSQIYLRLCCLFDSVASNTFLWNSVWNSRRVTLCTNIESRLSCFDGHYKHFSSRFWCFTNDRLCVRACHLSVF